MRAQKCGLKASSKMSSPSPKTFTLPDTLAAWPWPRMLNSHYTEVKAESSAWLESFHAFGPKAQKAFNKCDFSKFLRANEVEGRCHAYCSFTISFFSDLLSSLAYPSASKGQFRN